MWSFLGKFLSFSLSQRSPFFCGIILYVCGCFSTPPLYIYIFSEVSPHTSATTVHFLKVSFSHGLVTCHPSSLATGICSFSKSEIGFYVCPVKCIHRHGTSCFKSHSRRLGNLKLTLTQGDCSRFNARSGNQTFAPVQALDYKSNMLSLTNTPGVSLNMFVHLFRHVKIENVRHWYKVPSILLFLGHLNLTCVTIFGDSENVLCQSLQFKKIISIYTIKVPTWKYLYWRT